MRSTSGSRTCSIIARMRSAPRARVEIGVDAQHLVDLAADRNHRIERGHRLLKDHRHGGGAHCRRRRSPAVSSSSPTSLTLPPDGTSEPFCNRPITVERGDRFCRIRFRRPGTASRLRAPASETPSMMLAHCGFLPRPTTRLSMSRTTLFRIGAAFTCRPPAVSCGDRARRARRRRSD